MLVQTGTEFEEGIPTVMTSHGGYLGNQEDQNQNQEEIHILFHFPASKDHITYFHLFIIMYNYMYVT